MFVSLKRGILIRNIKIFSKINLNIFKWPKVSVIACEGMTEEIW